MKNKERKCSNLASIGQRNCSSLRLNKLNILKVNLKQKITEK